MQVTVGEPADDGSRPVAVHTRPEPAAGAGAAAEGHDLPGWTRHASGTLAAALGDDAGAADQPTPEAWPPVGGEPIDLDGLYDGLATLGYGYGPSFQGAAAAWRRGDEVFAEVRLDGDQAGDAGRYGIHPALLDAAFHAAIGGLHAEAEPGRVPLPFAFRGVTLHRPGVAALRVRLGVAEGGEAVAVDAVDAEGAPVLSVGALVVRQVDATALRAAGRNRTGSRLFSIGWEELDVPATGDSAVVGVVGDLLVDGVEGARRFDDVREVGDAVGAGAVGPGVVLVGVPTGDVGEVLAWLLDVVQQWLADERLAWSRLVFVSRGRVPVGGGASDVVVAGVWGFLRSVEAEHPGRFGAVDLDDVGDLHPGWDRLLGADEGQLVVRGGVVSGARLRRAPAAVAPASEASAFGTGAVLVTGGTGGLGALVARHLVVAHGVDDLVLVSRRGSGAPGAEGLVDELEGLGARVRVVACDVSDRGELSALVGGLAGELSGVVHAAGVVDDATVESLTPAQLRRVLAPKVDAALFLDELTAGLGLSAFVVFSSAAGVIGSPGQGNYAAANAVLDALAVRRRAAGLAGSSVAWGLWDGSGGMGAEVGAAGLARLARLGMVALAPDVGLELFDAAVAGAEPVVVAAGLDVAGVERAGP